MNNIIVCIVLVILGIIVLYFVGLAMKSYCPKDRQDDTFIPEISRSKPVIIEEEEEMEPYTKLVNLHNEKNRDKMNSNLFEECLKSNLTHQQRTQVDNIINWYIETRKPPIGWGMYMDWSGLMKYYK